MRVFLFFLLSLALLAADFDWVESLQKAKVLAKKEHKPIMLMIDQKGCHMCEYMDEVTFENEDVVDFVEENFIPLKLNIDKAKRAGFKAYGTPTFYFLDAKASPLLPRPLAGAATPKVFLETLKKIKRDINGY